ncbi:hypothetical protein D9M72_474530 [compost metagenome]
MLYSACVMALFKTVISSLPDVSKDGVFICVLEKRKPVVSMATLSVRAVFVKKLR